MHITIDWSRDEIDPIWSGFIVLGTTLGLTLFGGSSLNLVAVAVVYVVVLLVSGITFGTEESE